MPSHQILLGQVYQGSLCHQWIAILLWHNFNSLHHGLHYSGPTGYWGWQTTTEAWSEACGYWLVSHWFPVGSSSPLKECYTNTHSVCIASVITIIYSIQYPNHTDEMPRDTAPSFIWGNVEMNIAILSGKSCSRPLLLWPSRLNLPACVPLLRPVFRHILPKSFLSSYGSSHPISRTNLSRTNHSHAIKLSTITRSNEHDAFDASSTHKIVDPEEGMSSHSNLDQRPDAFQTIITSNNLSSSRSYSSDEDAAAAGGIYMRNDISVHVEEKQHAYEMRR